MIRPSGPRRETPPGPQSLRRTRPIDTAPMAVVPIMVKTTRRERFMWRLPSGFGELFLNGHQFPSPEDNDASESKLFHRIVRPTPVRQPTTEKCDVKARYNVPKTPRHTQAAA